MKSTSRKFSYVAAGGAGFRESYKLSTFAVAYGKNQ